MFLNVAAFSVYIIVIRKNVLALAKPGVDSDRVSKSTVAITVLLLGLVLIISYFLRNDIQIVLDFTGGILGSFILFIMPSLEVYKARQLATGEGEKQKKLGAARWMPLVVIGVGVAAIVFNLYQTISNLLK